MENITFYCYGCGGILNGDTLKIKFLPGGQVAQICENCGRVIQINF